MGGDDFQKDGPNLRLRDAIEETLRHHDDLVKEKADELFTEMEIIDGIKLAIDAGQTDCRVDFPEDMKQFPDGQFSGQATYRNVVEALVSLLSEEGVLCVVVMEDGWDLDEDDDGNDRLEFVTISGFIPS